MDKMERENGQEQEVPRRRFVQGGEDNQKDPSSGDKDSLVDSRASQTESDGDSHTVGGVGLHVTYIIDIQHSDTK